ncbi:MAG: flagellar biosynthesis protein FlhF [Phycisphaerales bacterium]|nr:flagellar biosynthesis protein FlhF [Phycisphaerales bacterium]
MDVRTYQAYTMAEALTAVKRDLGPDAVILSTRSFRRGGIFGIGRRTIIEVSARSAERSMAGSRSDNDPARPTQRPGATPARTPSAPSRNITGARKAYAAGSDDRHLDLIRSLTVSSEAGNGSRDERTTDAARDLAETLARNNVVDDSATSPGAFGPSRDDRERTRRLAIAIAEQHERRRKEASRPAARPAEGGPSTTTPAESGDVKFSPSSSSPATAPSASSGELATASDDGALTPDIRLGPQTNPVAKRFVLTSSGGGGTGGGTGGGSGSGEGSSSANEVAMANAASVAGTAGVTSVSFTESPLAHRSGARATVGMYAGDRAAVGAMAPSSTRGSRTSANAEAMHSELTAIKHMVGEVLQRQSIGRSAPMPSMPQQLFEYYLKLVAQDISEELADRILDDVRDELGTEGCEDAEAVQTAILRHLSGYIPCAETPVSSHSPDGRPLTVALIGPTGVGKTTTVAKLAASFKLRHGRKVGLITADTYRIAAVDQLRTYANIIGLPLQVVLTPADMRQAVHSLSDCDVILIDTAGRSQRDHSRLEELRAFLDAASPHEVHLVLSSTASEKVLLQESEAFSAVGVDKVVLTKLDEAVSFGMLVNVIRKVGKELSFFTTGQEVPDHIELGRPDRLAELILGGELHA